MDPEYKFRTLPRKSVTSEIGSESSYIARGLLNLHRDMSTEDQHVDQHSDARLLFDAIHKGKPHLVRFILEAAPGDIANAVDNKGKTPLINSCLIKEHLRREMTARLLLNQGAEVNRQDDQGRTVLSYASELKCNDIVKLLIQHNDVDPDVVDNKGNTALIYGAIVGNDIALELLTRHFRRLGLNVDHANENGNTALLMAAKYGNITCGKILVQQGQASLLLRDRVYGYSVKDWLSLNGYSLEDITPIFLGRDRARAKFVKAINITRLSVPKPQLENVFVGKREDIPTAKATVLPKISHAKVVPMPEKRNENGKAQLEADKKPDRPSTSANSEKRMFKHNQHTRRSMSERVIRVKDAKILPLFSKHSSMDNVIKVNDLLMALQPIEDDIQIGRKSGGRHLLYVEGPDEDICDAIDVDPNPTGVYTLCDSDSDTSTEELAF